MFRALWIAVLVSNVGAWMQTVGAQWLLVQQPHAAILVPLVQTADMLPDVLFGVVVGVLADMFDQRRLLIGMQAFMVTAGAALTALTVAGQMPPALLLTFTFVIGAGSVITLPAYQSLIPELVPRAQLPSASTLGSISINVARSVGPALAGLLIARIGVGAVFGINTLTFLVFGLVVGAWHPPADTVARIPEHFTSALLAGGRYVRYSPVVRRVLLRITLFLVPASVLWAMLPLVATQRLNQGSGGYGLLLGALGLGAVAGSFVLPRVRAQLSDNGLMVAASLVYAAVLVIVALVPNTLVAVLVLLPAGMAWIAVLSSMNALLQLFLPAWVRARGLSVYLTVMFGSQAVGAVLWGLVASSAGVVAAFVIAAALMTVGIATVGLWPLVDTRGMDRRAAAYWPEPHLTFETEPDSGPVVVRTTYTVTLEAEQAFLRAMARVRLSRMRTGATQWGLFREGEKTSEFVELFVVPSWDEHLRQHADRLTATDQRYQEEAEALSDPPPHTTHLIAADVDLSAACQGPSHRPPRRLAGAVGFGGPTCNGWGMPWLTNSTTPPRQRLVTR